MYYVTFSTKITRMAYELKQYGCFYGMDIKFEKIDDLYTTAFVCGERMKSIVELMLKSVEWCGDCRVTIEEVDYEIRY